jgi:membrane associated rhomboid family serine protease
MRSFRAVRWIIWANVAVALVSLVCYTLGLVDVPRQVMPLHWSGVLAGHWWEFLTYMWIHAQFEGAGVLHIVCNMMTLAPFGRMVEGTLGSRAFLGIYFAGGLGGACGFVIESGLRRWLAGPVPDFDPGMVGASAAVLGVVAAFAVLQPSAQISLLFLPFRLRAGRFLLLFGAISLVMIFIPSLQFIAHSAHIGGMLGGWLWVRWIVGHRNSRKFMSDSELGSVPSEFIRLEVESLTEEAIRLETDLVLDKISRLGLEQLNERDRWILARAKRLFMA